MAAGAYFQGEWSSYKPVRACFPQYSQFAETRRNKGYIRRSARYMNRTGMDALFTYNRIGNADLPLSAEIADLYRRYQRDLLGIFLN
jgi:hypothetical protein